MLAWTKGGATATARQTGDGGVGVVLRSAPRFQFELDHRDNGLGFRVIRVIR